MCQWFKFKEKGNYKVSKENMNEFLYNHGVGEGLFNYDSKSRRYFFKRLRNLTTLKKYFFIGKIVVSKVKK